MFYILWYQASNRVEPSLASLSTAIMPISTIVIAWLALGELISGERLLGMGFVIASIVTYAMPPLAKIKLLQQRKTKIID